jgi:lipopolysaccharide transport system permease protein
MAKTASAAARLLPGLGSFLAQRWLLLNLFKRELTNRYVGTTSGWVWAFMQPLLLLAVYWFIFTMVFRPPQLSGEHYLVFVAVALWPWIALQDSLLRGASCVQGYASLIRKVAFPHELIVYSTVGAIFFLHFIGYVIVLTALFFFGEPLHPAGVPVTLWLWMVLLVAACGIVFLLCALQVFLRDLEHVLGPVISILIYLAPILYPLTIVPENLRPWVQANPFSFLVERLREVLLGEGSAWPRWEDAIALAVACAIFAIGRGVFLRLSPYFEDYV